MTQQHQNIFGTCGAHAHVNVVDRQGEIIATTRADALGNWCVETNVTIGASVRADVKNQAGRQVTSDWIEIAEQIEASAPEETAEERELRDFQEAEAAQCRQRLEAIYVDVVCSLADGYDCDFEAVGDLLTALCRSMEAFEADVTAMQNATYSAVLTDSIVCARLNTLAERATY